MLHPVRLLCALLVLLTLAPTTAGAFAPAAGRPSIVAFIPVGSSAQGVAVNPQTNRIYVSKLSSALAVLDGATNTVTGAILIPNGGKPQGPTAVAVNPTTNRIYTLIQLITNAGAPNDLVVADGATNTVLATVTLGSGGGAIAVNPVTNRVYVAQPGGITVLDGTTNAILTTIPLAVGNNGQTTIAVNPQTNRIYVPTTVSSQPAIVAIDGTTNTVVASTPIRETNIQLGGLAVNPAINRVYLTEAVPVSQNLALGRVVVIDGTSMHRVTTIALGGVGVPADLAANPVTHHIFVAVGYPWVPVLNGNSNTVMRILSLISPSAFAFTLAVNPATNRCYVLDFTDGVIEVIQDRA